jgi:hypothetical protein
MRCVKYLLKNIHHEIKVSMSTNSDTQPVMRKLQNILHHNIASHSRRAETSANTAVITLKVTKLKLSMCMSLRHMEERKYNSTHSYPWQYIDVYCWVKGASCSLNRRLGGVHGRYGRFGGEVFLRLP